MNENFAAIILAAGESKRFKSEVSKIFHKLLGKPIIEYVVEALLKVNASPVIIVGSPADITFLRKLFGNTVTVVPQNPPLGTGHAVLQAQPVLKDFRKDVCVVVGDCPLITPEFISALYNTHRRGRYAATLTTVWFDKPPPYGRVIRDEQGQILRIVEEKDATPEQLKIKEVSTSHYFFKSTLLFSYLKKVKNDNAQGEYYLTDVIGLLADDRYSIGAYQEKDALMLMGINTREELQKVSEYLNRRHIDFFLGHGVSVVDSCTTIIESDVEIKTDTILHPFTYLARGTRVGKGCEIGPFVYLKNCTVPDGSKVEPQLNYTRRGEDE